MGDTSTGYGKFWKGDQASLFCAFGGPAKVVPGGASGVMAGLVRGEHPTVHCNASQILAGLGI